MKNKKVLIGVIAVIVIFIVVIATAQAATTIGTNISTDGNVIVGAGGITFADTTTQTTAATAGASQVTRSFPIGTNSQTVSAGNVLGFAGGYVYKGYGNTILDSETVFKSASTYEISAAALDSTHFVVAYTDVGNLNYGTAVTSTISGTSIGTNRGNLIGIAAASGSVGQSISVIMAGISTVQSGLTAGTVYYAVPAGTLTTTSNSYKVGTALSATEILLNSNRDNTAAGQLF